VAYSAAIATSLFLLVGDDMVARQKLGLMFKPGRDASWMAISPRRRRLTCLMLTSGAMPFAIRPASIAQALMAAAIAPAVVLGMLMVGDLMLGISVRAMIVVAMFVRLYKGRMVASGTLVELRATSDRFLAF
jgi:hypothetical protein